MAKEVSLAPAEVEIAAPARGIEVVQATLERFLEAAQDVNAVYGKPVKNGDIVIIPAAEALTVLGFGAGYGGGSDPEGRAAGGGGGGGGGGRSFSRPVAVIIASPEGVRVEPVVDVTKIALAALTAGGFMLATLLRMTRPRRGLQPEE